MFMFVNFIACGTQFYQVSVKDDIDKPMPESALDPTSTLYGIHAPTGWYQLPIKFKFGDKMNDMQKNALSSAMKRWQQVVGKQLFLYDGIHKGVTGDSFKDLYSSLQDGINGHYIDENWKKTEKPTFVLATTIWDNLSNGEIGRADIRFNSENYVIGDSLMLTSVDNKEVVDMESLALHELGHLLGLAHIDDAVDALSIMNPTLFIGEGLTSRKLSRHDIDRIQTIYGCEGSACNVEALVRNIELVESEVE
jgi:hypothetical protein